MLYIASDHAGFELKQLIINKLISQNITVEDLGPSESNPVDYPDFAHPLSIKVLESAENKGILICGSGNGVCITANKHQGIRAALCWTEELAQLARSHNDANIICLPARYVNVEVAENMVQAFLQTPFEGGRHQKRVEKI